MKKSVLGVFLILLLIPFSQGFAQQTDNAPTISASLVNESPYVYQDSEGYTVVVGEVINRNSLTPITNVRIQVIFFNDFDPNPLEIKEDKTTLEVIPPDGKSPFVIRSTSPNPDITQASISLLGFDSSASKQKELTVSSTGVALDTSLHFSGILQNGGAPNSDTNVYLAFYDGFEPPRILGVSTIELGDVESDSETAFEFDGSIDSKARGFFLFSESDIFYSDFVDVELPAPQNLTKLAKISAVTIEDNMGRQLSEIKVGSTVNLKSNIQIQFAADQKSNETAYTYYVQIKESGKFPSVEYIGKSDGRFIGTGTQSQSIDWIPEKNGLFFIETFVWDRNNIPIADPGPFVLIHVN